MRETVFISYSHKDQYWYTLFERAMNIGGKAHLDVWSDKKIGTGDHWEAKIESAIKTARVALLLVTYNFLGSEFIQCKELASLLDRQKAGDLSIWWVPIDALSADQVEVSGLKPLQAACPSDKSLAKLKGRSRSGAISDIAAKLIKAMGLIADTAKSTRDELQQSVSSVLGRDMGITRPLAPGDYSIVYEAVRRSGDRVAVKAMVPMPRREWLAEDFIDRAEAVREVSNPHIIKILDIFRQVEDPLSKRKVDFVVMELTSAPTLATVLKERQLAPAEVARIVSQLANAASELHCLEEGKSETGRLVLGPVRPNQIFYDASKKIRISLVHISNETMQSCNARPILLLDADTLTCLSPERYDGESVTQATDQYYLALLALELLLGRPPVLVQKFSDLKKKDAFFNDPKASFGDLISSEPALAFILMKMLEREPQSRWPSMRILSAALEQLAQGRLPDVVREYAANLHNTLLHRNNDFFRRFYDCLFELSPDAKEIFEVRKTDMRKQHTKLDAAMYLMLGYSPEVNSLYDAAEQHSTMGLRIEHFDAFRDAFLYALSELPLTNNAYAQCAWRAVLEAGFIYMRRQCCADSRDSVSCV